MKKGKTFMAAAVTALVLAGCTREEIFPVSAGYGEPVTATLAIGMSSIPEVVVTKAASGDDYSSLNSLLLVFFTTPTDGSEPQFVTTLNTASGDVTLSSTSTEVTTNTYNHSGIQYTATFTIETGTYNVVGIGNFTNVQRWDGSIDGETSFTQCLNILLTGLANNSITYTQFLNRIFYISTSAYVDSGVTPTFNTNAVLLTGCNSIVISEADPAANATSVDADGELELYRGIANIEFKITSASYTKGSMDNDGSTDDDKDNIVTFTPSKYAVYNIPQGIRIDPAATGEYTATLSATLGTEITQSDYYYDTKTYNIGLPSTETATDGTSTSYYKFDFFMPENIQDDVTLSDDDTYTGYATREAWNGTYDSTTGKKNWTYAPHYATYVVIYGSYLETDSEGNQVSYSGDASYTVHLGDFSSDNNYDYGNYSVKRNSSYIYTITVRGINNVIAEVDGTSDNTPGVEGSILSLAETSYNFVLDAHYEQVLTSFDLNTIAGYVTSYIAAKDQLSVDNDADVNTAIGENLILHIETPFQDSDIEIQPYSLYVDAVGTLTDDDATTAAANAKSTALSAADYKWVEFYPQESSTAISAYPGIPAWNSSDGLTNSTDNSAYLIDCYDLCVAIGKAVKTIMGGGGADNGRLQ